MTLEVISEIIFNKIFLTIIITWALGQATKIILDWIYHRRITFSNLVELGGMLSTHATVVAAMTVVIYLDQGVSTLFIIVGIISVIVLRDAVGVRFEVEEHAKLLNKKFKTNLNENVGHRLKEVVVGVIFGVVAAVILYRIL
ncbi:MAG: divergent PAP2 family protein [Candidatus Woesearchaeota archaeon]|jgi:hypothetical protein|nr:divergent PAP2 family protein [Candidatus Woesearchaeota archaeon]